MASSTFSGQLSLVDFTVDEVARIDPKSQFDHSTSTVIYQIEGLLKDNLGETYELCVWIQHSVHRFHEEDWNFVTFAGGSRDTIPGTQKFGKGRMIQGGFTCVHQTRKDEYAVDPRMSQFKLALFDKTGRRKFTTAPFNHDVWWSFVHENATVMFVESKPAAFTLSVIMQYAGIVDSEPKYWPYTGEATEFHHADNGLTLFEYGRWRSKDTLDWILHNDYDGVPDSIKEEIRDLCSKYAANEPSSFQPKARQPTPPPATRSSGSHHEPRHAAQRPAPPAPPKRAPPAPPVPLNPDISRGDAMKESVEKALAFQRPDPAAMRAALQSVGGFRSEASLATPRVPDAGQIVVPPLRQETMQLAGTTSNVDQNSAPLAGAPDTPMSNAEPTKGTVEGKRPAAVAGLEDTAAKKLTSDAVATPSASDRSDERSRLLAALELANEAMSKANAKHREALEALQASFGEQESARLHQEQLLMQLSALGDAESVRSVATSVVSSAK